MAEIGVLRARNERCPRCPAPRPAPGSVSGLLGVPSLQNFGAQTPLKGLGAVGGGSSLLLASPWGFLARMRPGTGDWSRGRCEPGAAHEETCPSPPPQPFACPSSPTRGAGRQTPAAFPDCCPRSRAGVAASRLHPLPPPRNSLWDRPGGRGSMAPSRAGWPKPTGPCSAGLRAPFPNHHPAPLGASGAPRAACGSGEAGSDLPSASSCLLQPRVAQGFLVKMVLGQNVPRKLL